MSAAKTLASIAAPAPQVAEEPTVQVKQQSAKQKARIDKGLPETLIESVRVDGLVSSHLISIFWVLTTPQKSVYDVSKEIHSRDEKLPFSRVDQPLERLRIAHEAVGVSEDV